MSCGNHGRKGQVGGVARWRDDVAGGVRWMRVATNLSLDRSGGGLGAPDEDARGCA